MDLVQWPIRISKSATRDSRALGGLPPSPDIERVDLSIHVVATPYCGRAAQTRRERPLPVARQPSPRRRAVRPAPPRRTCANRMLEVATPRPYRARYAWR